MKYLFASDIHGSRGAAEQVLARYAATHEPMEGITRGLYWRNVK